MEMGEKMGVSPDLAGLAITPVVVHDHLPSCSRCRRPTYCASVPFHEIGITRKRVSRRASSHHSGTSIYAEAA